MGRCLEACTGWMSAVIDDKRGLAWPVTCNKNEARSRKGCHMLAISRTGKEGCRRVVGHLNP